MIIELIRQAWRDRKEAIGEDIEREARLQKTDPPVIKELREMGYNTEVDDKKLTAKDRSPI